ncbi:MAG: ATP-dependent zinc metalloprotease FtsH [Candidatus Dojkabacteria bacterium]|nr:ATP-dependent zinc metalloprotease FtsH [Candidatus Dojkabacteria bacterium]
MDEAREELNEIVDFLKNPGKYRKLGARIPKGILMFGPPGTGKTLLARAIAGEAGVPFFHTSGSEFEEMLVGAGASRVRDLFDKAKKASPALIFIDEIDAVARKRGTRVQSGSTEQTLNQILVEMDGFEKNVNVIVIAATNRPDVLDRAILRPGRFDRQVRIELPDKDGRFKILKLHGKNKPFAKDVNLERIAKRTVGFTGADLENILNEAAIISAKAGQKEIFDADIDEAVSKVVIGPAKRSRKRTENELKLVAYHEAGHALVSHFTPNSTPVDKISIVSRGGTGGVTMFLPEKDESIISKGKLLADIVVSLGGRAAEEIVLEDISTGASNDIEQATSTARRMIQKFGMNDKLGLVQYGQSMDNQYLGYHYGDSKDFSESTAELIDKEIRETIGKAYEQAKKIITDHKAKLDEIAKILLEKEVMDKEEFEKLFDEKK